MTGVKSANGGSVERRCFSYQQAVELLLNQPRTWLITGVAGFIGSNLAEQLLLLNQKVIGIDNFFSGSKNNLNQVFYTVENQSLQFGSFKNSEGGVFNFHEIDINNYLDCEKIFHATKIDHILHHAAVASVPLSIKNPKLANHVNIDGFINILELAKKFAVRSISYASSSAVYGDDARLIKVEEKLGSLLSPYAVTKYANELYASQYASHYNLHCTGLRYFNIYGKRQDPNGAYAAVIPKWISSILANESISINGDGYTTRDFCSIDNVIKANILSSVNIHLNSRSSIYNIGVGQALSLNNLFDMLVQLSNEQGINYNLKPIYRDFAPGDIKHSCADISLAQQAINYHPDKDFYLGLKQLLSWFIKNNGSKTV